jgi:hypothetical protein
VTQTGNRFSLGITAILAAASEPLFAALADASAK